MRIWSLHPKYLDPKGLVALWRETLLAQKVLQGSTKGYINHPQLNRFKAISDPISAVGTYLLHVANHAHSIGYNFDHSKIISSSPIITLEVTEGQMQYEFEHLKRKLLLRDTKKYHLIENITSPEPHPIFTILPGPIADWEKI